MEDDFEYFQQKFSHVKLQQTKSRFRIGHRNGSTLRRNGYVETSGKRHNNKSLILKHVSMPQHQKPRSLKQQLEFDDGGLDDYGHYPKSNKRGKTARSVLAKEALESTKNQMSESTMVAYSLNKKKRWLVPAALKVEIEREQAISDVHWKATIDLTLVEREVSDQNHNNRRCRRPDVVSVKSTTLSDADKFAKTKRQKNHRKTYSWSTDLLGISHIQRRGLEIEIDSGNMKPEVTYEVCETRRKGPYFSKSASSNPRKEGKNRFRRSHDNAKFTLQDISNNDEQANDSEVYDQ